MVTYGGVPVMMSGNSNVYNDPRLSRAQPWRSRYPTPHDLKDKVAGSYAASTDHEAYEASIWKMEGDRSESSNGWRHGRW